MIKNYFKTAWRSIVRSKMNSSINILGLALGLACTLLIILFVKDELTYDRFLNNTENIYRVILSSNYRGETNTHGNTGYLQGPEFKENIPGITDFVRIQGDAKVIKFGDDLFNQEALRVDTSFFNVFSFPLISGDRKTCLSDPLSVVISEKLALKLFGTSNVIGKTLLFKIDDNFSPHKVVAVAKDVPQNSTVKFDMLLPIQVDAAEAANKENWFNFFLNTFIVVKPGSDIDAIRKSMNTFFEADSKAAYEKMKAMYGIKEDISTQYALQSILQLHLSKTAPAQNGLTGASRSSYSYILGGIALFILLIACINFINLSLAQSMKRAKEIGIRKVMGGARKQLIGQFLGESFLLCFISFVIAIGIVWISLPLFNTLSGKELSFGYLWDIKLFSTLILLLICTALIAGFYPALIMSGFSPVRTLYSRFTFTGKVGLQKALVVLQFTLASFLIAGTLVMYQQFRFMSKYDLGINNENVLTVNNYQVNSNNYNFFRNKLLQNPAIADVTAVTAGYMGVMIKLPNDSMFQVEIARVANNYIPYFGLHLLQGRDFSKDLIADSVTQVVVNEAMIKKAGWKDPVGQTFKIGNNGQSIAVMGVVKDYHKNSLMQAIEPLVLTMNPEYGMADMHIRIAKGQNLSAMKFVEKSFKEVFPGTPYRVEFRDDAILRSYDSENRWKKIIFAAALITLFISCIGLFGMTVLSAEKRAKEVGVRKVLGATVKDVSLLLSKDFLLLVMLALCISIPTAWILANKWLQHYAFRFNLNWKLFGIATIITIIIAVFTVSIQTIKAAVTNPIKSLRTE